MSDLPRHYKLHSDNEKHFTIHDERDGKKFNVMKKHVHPATQIKILKMQKFSGESGDPEDQVVRDEDGETPVAPEIPMSQEQPQPEPMQSAAPNPIPEVIPQTDSTPQVQAPNWSAPMLPGQAPAQPQAAQAQPQVGAGYPTSGEVKKYTDQAVGGVYAEASAQQKQNLLMAEQYKKDQEEQQKYFATQQEKMNQYQQQYDQMSKSVASGEIDPSHYWHEKSTGQKIGLAISMILGGIGAGLSHGPNQAMEVINKNIENDIESQKQNLGNKRSLLSQNLQAQGNLLAATNATRLQMSAMAQGRLLQLAAESGNPIIAARAQQNAAKIAEGTMQLRTSLADHEIQMQIRKEVLGRMGAQGTPGAQKVDVQDLARAGLIDKATAEKEGAAIAKRQQAEAYASDQVRQLNQEQSLWGNGIIPNPLNPESYNRRDQYRAGIIQAIQSASSSKRLTPEMIALQVEPFLTKTLHSQETRDSGLNGIIGLIRSHADPTPMATYYKAHGALEGGNINRKKFDLGPVK